MKNNALALVAAVGGAVVGYYAFLWISKQGFLALVLPGGLIGLAASMFKSRSIAVCSICGVMGLFVSLFSEWSRAPFIKDKSFGFFVQNAYQLPMVTLIMIVAGTVLAFWIPFNHRGEGAARSEAPSA